jgi:excisionase family DNA binding protein
MVTPVTDSGQIFLTSGMAAKAIGCSDRTVTRLALKGTLPYVQKLGGLYLFDPAAVQKYIDTHTKDS